MSAGVTVAPGATDLAPLIVLGAVICVAAALVVVAWVLLQVLAHR